MTPTERVIFTLFCETLDTIGEDVPQLTIIFNMAKTEGIDVVRVVDLVEMARFNRAGA